MSLTAVSPSLEPENMRRASSPAIRIRGLRKSYNGIEAVSGIDLDVFSGEIFAFLGPNGAGKTTAIEILEGYRTRDAGQVEVLGFDPADATAEWRARIGVVLQTCLMPAELTVYELLSRYAGYYSHPRGVDGMVDLVGLSDKRDARAGRLSGGQQRRLDVALALVGDPDLVFLDEPTTGFDPGARHHAWHMIEDLRALGKTVLLTTHYMDEAEALADRVAIMVDGALIAVGSPQDIVQRSGAQSVVKFSRPAEVDPQDLPTCFGLASRAGRGVEIQTETTTEVLGELLDWARDRKIELSDLTVERPGLEDVYLELTKDRR